MPRGLLASLAHTGVIGANASGKRTLLRELERQAIALRKAVQVVDFNAHFQLVAKERELTVARMLGGFENTDVVVRFGLMPLWWRKVGSLSTGEARKVLLATAVCADPDVLILDRPFDGLDQKSRQALVQILEDVTSGRTAARPLVQGVKWKQRKPLQLFLVSHRPLQEFPSSISRIVKCFGVDQPPAVLARSDLATELQNSASRHKDESILDIHTVWGTPSPSSSADLTPVIHVSNLTVFPTAPRDAVESKHDKKIQGPILNRVSWTVLPREVWWLAGDNGASKSALLNCAVDSVALMELASEQHRKRTWEVEVDPEADRRRKRPPVVMCSGKVSFVSTEMHLAVLEAGTDPTVAQLLGTDRENCLQLCSLLDLSPSTLDRKFSSLSLGEQKLSLIARALAVMPRLLVLDEAMQALDAEHRARVGRIVNSIASSKDFDVAVVIVSHHLDELPRVVTHRLHMVAGTVASRGPWTPSVSR